MSLLDRFKLRNTAGDEVTKSTRESIRVNMGYGDENEESKDLSEVVPFKINRNIPNFRYAYKYNDTINTTIKNIIVTANSEWTIDCDDKKKYREAYEYIIEKSFDWKLEELANNLIKYPMVDGCIYVNRYLDEGSYKFRILGNDNDRFKWLNLRDPNTDEIVGYKQKARVKKINGNWKSFEFDTLASADYEDKEYNFDPDEIIYVPYMEEDGEGVSAIESCLDLAYMENKILQYMLSSCRNAGGFLGVEFGNEDIDAGGLDSNDIKEVTDAFELDGDKSVVGYPYGIKPNEVGNSNIPNYDNIIKLLQSKIRNNLLTPDSKFNGSNSNRSTTREQLNSNDTGFITFIKFIQEFVAPVINEEIFNKELELKYPDAVGHIKFKYVMDIDNEKELSEIGATVITNYPNLPTELVLSTYYGRVWKNVEKYKDLYGDEWEDKIESDLGKMETMYDESDGENVDENEDVEVGDRPHKKIHEMSVLGQNAYNRSQHHKKIMLQGTGKNKQGSVQDKQKG